MLIFLPTSWGCICSVAFDFKYLTQGISNWKLLVTNIVMFWWKKQHINYVKQRCSFSRISSHRFPWEKQTEDSQKCKTHRAFSCVCLHTARRQLTQKCENAVCSFCCEVCQVPLVFEGSLLVWSERATWKLQPASTLRMTQPNTRRPALTGPPAAKRQAGIHLTQTQ